MKIVTEDGQCAWDIAIQAYGDIRELFRLIADNDNIEVNSALQSATEVQIQVTPSNPANAGMLDYFRRGVNVNTHLVITDSNYLLQEDDSLLQQEDNSNLLIL